MTASFEPVMDLTTIPIIHDAGPCLAGRTPSHMSFSIIVLCSENRIIGAEG
jgi:hypothetical protein